MRTVRADLPRFGGFVATTVAVLALVGVTLAFVGVADAQLARLIGTAGWSWVLIGAGWTFPMLAAVLAWREEPTGSSLSGVFGGQIASPRSRSARGEIRRAAWVAAFVLGAFGAAVAAWGR